MALSQKQVEEYDMHGFVIVEDVFSEKEVAAMLREVESGQRVAKTRRSDTDASGKTAGIAIWTELGDDIWAAASTHPGIVNAVRILMREEIEFYHGKVMLKEAGGGGAWEWHQDYGYWYGAGFVFPRMMSAFVALDPATKLNGCLQVLSGSHKLGRLEHGKVGTQQSVNTDRISEVESYFERIHCVMKPGSVVFFDCNLLHTSASNDSDSPRRSFIMCYNALANPQLRRETTENRPCPVAFPKPMSEFCLTE